MRPPRAVVFDLDGTLVDSREDIAAACNHALVSLGQPMRSSSEIAGFVGDGARSLVARAFGLPTDDPGVDEALAVFNAYYSAHSADRTTLLPGALDALNSAGVPLALATNKPRSATLPLLRALDIEERFVHVVAGGDGPLKPDPAAVHAALAPLGVSATDAWMVGDGAQDVIAGKRAGAFTVALLGGFGREAALRSADPDRVLGSLLELARLFESVRGG